MNIPEESIEKGRKVRQALGRSPSPRHAGNSPAFDLVPGLEDWVMGAVFGELWGRPQLDVKTRCAITLGMLTVLGREPQVRAYVGYALNVGWTPEEVSEIVLHTTPYGGVPAALNALNVMSEVFAERGLPTKVEG